MKPVIIRPPALPEGDAAAVGWAAIEWAQQTLVQPDGPTAGGPLDLTGEQIRLLLWWYQIDPATGRMKYRRGTLRRMKGWGKDPLAAIIALIEFAGPCRYTPGRGVHPHPAPWVQIAATSREQTRTTMTLLPGMLGGKDQAKRLGIDLGKEICYADGGRARLEAVTSSPRALEGSRATLTIANEIHHWIAGNEGHTMWEAIARNAAKGRDANSRALALTNAWMPGEDSVAERDWESWEAIASGKSAAEGVLYDCVEAPADFDLSDRTKLREALTMARGDSHWLDVDRLADEILDPRTPVSMSRRFYLNQIVAVEDSWIAPVEWDRCAVSDRLEPGDAVTLGFDGSRTGDATGLVACRVSDGLLTRLGLWQAPEGAAGTGWQVDRDEVDATVRAACAAYRVVGFYADLALWESYIDTWRDTVALDVQIKASPGHPIAYDMRGRRYDFTRAADRFLNDVTQDNVIHDGDRLLRQHILNARRSPNRWGVSIRKESHTSSRKIDLAVCAVLARQARIDYLAAGPQNSSRRRSGRVKAFT